MMNSINETTSDNRVSSKATLEVWYDGWCPMCTGIKHRLVRLDWLHRLQFQSTRDPKALAASELRHISTVALEQRLHVRYTKNGKLRSGIEAIESIAAHIPLLWLTWPFIRISRMLGLGQRLYDYIAARRMIVPTGACTEESCEWKPS